jgi:hypothetical protein
MANQWKYTPVRRMALFLEIGREDPGWRLVQFALPTDAASLPVHPAEEPAALVEEQPHVTPDSLEAKAYAMADRAAGQEPVEGPA